MGKISTSPRYVIEITGLDAVSLRSWGEGGGLILEKLEKMSYF